MLARIRLGQIWELGTQSWSCTWVTGTQVHDLPLLFPRMYIRMKLELGAELRLKPRLFHNGVQMSQAVF